MHTQSDGFVPGLLASSQNNPPVLFNKTGGLFSPLRLTAVKLDVP